LAIAVHVIDGRYDGQYASLSRFARALQPHVSISPTLLLRRLKRLRPPSTPSLVGALELSSDMIESCLRAPPETLVEVTDGPFAGEYKTLVDLFAAACGPAFSVRTARYRLARSLRPPTGRLRLSAADLVRLTGPLPPRGCSITVDGQPLTLTDLRARVPYGYRSAALRLAATGPHSYPSFEALLAACAPIEPPPQHRFRVLNGPLRGDYSSARSLAVAVHARERISLPRVRTRLARWRRLLSPPPGAALELTGAQLDALMHQTLRGSRSPRSPTQPAASRELAAPPSD
jgi:hypothetical protein